jgi:hypothetical protein
MKEHNPEHAQFKFIVQEGMITNEFLGNLAQDCGQEHL